MIVEGNGVLIRTISSNDFVQIVAFVTVNIEIVVIVLLCLQILLKLLLEELAFLFQLLFLLYYIIAFDSMNIDEVYFWIFFELDWKLPIYLGEIDDVTCFFSWVKTSLDNFILEYYHFLMYFLGEGTVELLCLCDEFE